MPRDNTAAVTLDVAERLRRAGDMEAANEIEALRQALQPFAEFHDVVLDRSSMYLPPHPGSDPASHAKPLKWNDLERAANIIRRGKP